MGNYLLWELPTHWSLAHLLFSCGVIYNVRSHATWRSDAWANFYEI